MKTTFDNLGGRDGRAERAAIKGDFLKLKTKNKMKFAQIYSLCWILSKLKQELEFTSKDDEIILAPISQHIIVRSWTWRRRPK